MRNISTLLLQFRWRGSYPPSWPSHRRPRWKYAACLYMFCSCQSSIGTCQILEGRVGFTNNRQNECLGVAFVIKFASSDIDRPDSGTSPVEGYVHDDSDAGCQLTIQISLNFFRPLLQIPPGDVVGKTSKWKCLFTPNEGKLFYEGRWWDGWPALSRWSIWKSSRYAPAAISPVTSHETVIRFYDEISREEPLNGKRRLEIYLALGDSEDVVGKAGRPKGSTKAARAAAEGRAAAIPPPAAATDDACGPSCAWAPGRPGHGSGIVGGGGSSGASSHTGTPAWRGCSSARRPRGVTNSGAGWRRGAGWWRIIWLSSSADAWGAGAVTNGHWVKNKPQRYPETTLRDHWDHAQRPMVSE